MVRQPVTVKSNLIALNKAIDKYVKKYNVDVGKVVKGASVGIISLVQKYWPVDYGQSRASWLPFLWSLGIAAPIKYGSGKKDMAKIRAGVKAGKFGYKFTGTAKPYAWIQNNTEYAPIIEYGRRRPGRSGLYRASKQSRRGVVRLAIKQYTAEFKRHL